MTICIHSPIQLIDLVHSRLHTYTTRRHARLGPATFAWHSSRSSTFPTEQFGLCNLCLVCPSFRDTPSHVFIATRSPGIILIPSHQHLLRDNLSIRASHILYLTSVLFRFPLYLFHRALVSGCDSLLQRAPFIEIQFNLTTIVGVRIFEERHLSTFLHDSHLLSLVTHRVEYKNTRQLQGQLILSFIVTNNSVSE